MKQYTSLWLVCLLAVFSMTARAQEGIETKARPDYPALPFMLTFEAPAEGSASLSISADGETLTSPTVYRTGTPSETVTPAATDNAYTFTRPAFPATAEVKYEKIQSAVTFTDPAHGSLALDAVTASGTIGLFSGKELAPGIAVKILATPADGYRMASGYPKVYRTGAPDETVPATFKPDASSGIAYLYTFTMPDFPVTVEV